MENENNKDMHTLLSKIEIDMLYMVREGEITSEIITRYFDAIKERLSSNSIIFTKEQVEYLCELATEIYNGNAVMKENGIEDYSGARNNAYTMLQILGIDNDGEM